LEDLFVEPAFRGRALGKRLMAHVARLAVGRGCQRLEWSALKWNQSAIDFYQSLGARSLDDWTMFRLSDESLDRLASQGDRDVAI
jgi:GNAT superfamily N-acetyltransferase